MLCMKLKFMCVNEKCNFYFQKYDILVIFVDFKWVSHDFGLCHFCFYSDQNLGGQDDSDPTGSGSTSLDWMINWLVVIGSIPPPTPSCIQVALLLTSQSSTINFRNFAASIGLVHRLSRTWHNRHNSMEMCKVLPTISPNQTPPHDYFARQSYYTTIE